MALLVMASAGFNTANAQSKEKRRNRKSKSQKEAIAITAPVGNETTIITTKSIR